MFQAAEKLSCHKANSFFNKLYDRISLQPLQADPQNEYFKNQALHRPSAVTFLSFIPFRIQRDLCTNIFPLTKPVDYTMIEQFSCDQPRVSQSLLGIFIFNRIEFKHHYQKLEKVKFHSSAFYECHVLNKYLILMMYGQELRFQKGLN